jgi:hypothetical protein
VYDKYGVNLKTNDFKGNFKWANRMQKVFKNQGKQWNDTIKNEIKYIIANYVKANPNISINEKKCSVLENLIETIELKIKI